MTAIIISGTYGHSECTAMLNWRHRWDLHLPNSRLFVHNQRIRMDMTVSSVQQTIGAIGRQVA